MKTLKTFYPLLSLIAVMLLAACSGGERLLNLVPADNVQAIATLRMDRMLDEAGCTRSDDGELTATAALNRLTQRNVTPAIISGLIPLSGALDLSECVAWVTSDNTTWLLCRITDSSKLDKKLAESGFTASAEGDFKLYSWRGGKMKWFVKDKYLWGSPDSDASAAELATHIEKAGKAPAAKIAGVGDYLASDGLARIAVANAMLGSGWVRGAISSKDSELTVSLSYVDEAGKVTEVKGLKKIDRSFLDFVPHDIPFLAAIGVAKDFNWNAVAKAAGLIFGFQVYGTIEAITPILKTVDGTVSVAFMPGSDDPFDTSADSMRFALFAEMKSGDARSALKKLRSYARRFGLPVSGGPDDSFAVELGESVYYAVYSSGYFIVANFKPERLTRHATMADGGLAAISMNLSPTTLGAVIGRGELTSPLQVTGSLTDDEATLHMRLTESDRPFLEALTTALAD